MDGRTVLHALRDVEPLDELTDGPQQIFLLVDRTLSSRADLSLHFPLRPRRPSKAGRGTVYQLFRSTFHSADSP